MQRLKSIQCAMSVGSREGQDRPGDAPSISINPNPAMLDEMTTVRIKGLSQYQGVTVVTTLKRDKGFFMSHAFYSADSNGDIDLSKQPSFGGTYTGIEAVGFFWSLHSTTEGRELTTYSKDNIPAPDDVILYVISGFQTIKNADDLRAHHVICNASHRRNYLAPGVRRLAVKEGNLRGYLYIPPGEGPFPGVMDVYGLVPGLFDTRAALLASKGFITFGLAYIGYEDLVGLKENRLNMEYFEEAVDWFAAHPQVSDKGIGVTGYSKGCDLCAYMAVYSQKVRAVVMVNGVNFFMGSSVMHYRRGIQLPQLPISQEDVVIKTDGGLTTALGYARLNIAETYMLKIEEAPWTHYMFIVGEDDQVMNPVFAQRMAQRLQRKGLNNYTILSYPGAGHNIKTPFSPVSTHFYSPVTKCMKMNGGQKRGTSEAQEKSWPQIISFLKERLT